MKLFRRKTVVDMLCMGEYVCLRTAFISAQRVSFSLYPRNEIEKENEWLAA